FKDGAADVLACDGAKTVVGAVWIFGRLKLPAVVAVHDQHPGRAADLRAVDARGLAFPAGADDRDFVILLRASEQAGVGVSLDIGGDIDGRSKGDAIAAGINAVPGADEFLVGPGQLERRTVCPADDLRELWAERHAARAEKHNRTINGR